MKMTLIAIPQPHPKPIKHPPSTLKAPSFLPFKKPKLSKPETITKPEEAALSPPKLSDFLPVRTNSKPSNSIFNHHVHSAQRHHSISPPFTPARTFTSTRSSRKNSSSAVHDFTNMERLILSPVKAGESEETEGESHPVTPTLYSLVPELLTHIFTFLPQRDRAALAQTCHYFNQILKNKQIWKGEQARLNLRPGQGQTFHSLIERGVKRVQVMSLKRSLRELTGHVKLTHLKLSGCYNVTDYSLNSMQLLPSLLELDLSLCKQVTDNGLVHILGKAPNLQKLDLGGCCNLTDRSCLLISYGMRNLKSLDLRSCYYLTDKALAYLAGQVNLSDRGEIKTYNFLARNGLIDCELCRRPKEGSSSPRQLKVDLRKIDKFTEFGMLSLDSLVLQDCQKISDQGLLHIGQMISPLRHLNLSFCVNVTDSGLKHLSNLNKSLGELNLRSCDNISDTGLLSFKDCVSLEGLDVSFCDKIASLSHQICRNLRTLSLSACNIRDSSFKFVGEMRRLETLNLGQCHKISDEGLNCIMEKCRNLKYIDLYGCSGLSAKGIQKLMNTEGLRKVNLGLWKI